MKKLFFVLSLVFALAALPACMEDGPGYISSQSFTDEVDSITVSRLDGVWYMTLICGNVKAGYGKDACLVLNVEPGLEKLDDCTFTCAPYGEPQVPGTFAGGFMNDKGLFDGSYALVAQGFDTYAYLLTAGTLTLKTKDNVEYDVKFTSTMGDAYNTISFSLTGSDVKLVYVDPVPEGDGAGE